MAPSPWWCFGKAKALQAGAMCGGVLVKLKLYKPQWRVVS